MKTNYRGFTLIELLVVIAIIAILAAILFPVFARAREKARQTTCTSNQRQIAASVQMFAQDHDETLPLSATFWDNADVDDGVKIW
jgi:prepilin-type N-terminal cleavage/methylation domain-containing protein